MPELYLFIVVILFALAISDLVVGVSNDAVNFLNSAIGSRVASRRTIMIVASIGIFMGASFSSGMMEVARKGIFNPEYYVFYDIMALFLAVMLTDIILLDLFNTFGLPTSTTVSIVFELLGAAFMIALIKNMGGQSDIPVGEYINSSGALAIIMGIFLSVGIAFLIGALVQYMTRLLLSFNYERKLKWVGTVWSGLAMAAMIYFLLIKGMKGASFIPDALTDWTYNNTWPLIGLTFVIATVIMFLIHQFLRVNILKLVVLFGTFSLAMAFAGNDLVNFIGVPVAGFESYNAWMASGEDPQEFSMRILGTAYPTKTYLLVGAGLIMIVTLWFSKKARSVTETEVNLGRQHEGLERFSPNWLSRAIVRFVYQLNKSAGKILPDSWLEKADTQFEQNEKPKEKKNEAYPAAFDLVRASVNLTVASALIALATSYKLPLSTTYVSFMVAMGTSLADRAWGRDSAVYRVAGVVNVIGGWFATAFIAFTVSATFALLIYHFQIYAIIGLVVLAILMIIRSFGVHRKREKAKDKREAMHQAIQQLEAREVIENTSSNTAESVVKVNEIVQRLLSGLISEDRSLIRAANKILKVLQDENMEFKYAFYSQIKRIREQETEASRIYLLVYDLEQDFLQSTRFIADSCSEHLDNIHSPLQRQQVEKLESLIQALDHFFTGIAEALNKNDYSNKSSLKEEKKAILKDIEKLLSVQVVGIKKASFNAINSFLFFNILLELKDLVAVGHRFLKLYTRLEEAADENTWILIDKEK
jgi:phosphate/sulfate permease